MRIVTLKSSNEINTNHPCSTSDAAAAAAWPASDPAANANSQAAAKLRSPLTSDANANANAVENANTGADNENSKSKQTKSAKQSTKSTRTPKPKANQRQARTKQTRQALEKVDSNKRFISANHRSTLANKLVSFGDTEDILSPHLAAYTNFNRQFNHIYPDHYYQETDHDHDTLSAKDADQLREFSLKCLADLHKHKRPFGRTYEWPTTNWIHNSTDPEKINLEGPQTPTAFKGKYRITQFDKQTVSFSLAMLLLGLRAKCALGFHLSWEIITLLCEAKLNLASAHWIEILSQI